MSEPICYLNGQWLPLAQACVPVLDRGFIFGDGVYEVLVVDQLSIDGQAVRAPFRVQAHLDRLSRSLAAIRIAEPLSPAQWMGIISGLIERHDAPRLVLYMQVTRGVAKREHVFPKDTAPTVFAMANPWQPIAREDIELGIRAITHTDDRWLHCDIKSISLLGNILLKQKAADQGASEAILLRDGLLTEGSSSNVWLVKSGVVYAPPPSALMLTGITYEAVLDVLRASGRRHELRTLSEQDLRSADELWVSASGRELMPVTRLDGEPVGSGAPGPVFKETLAGFAQAKIADARLWLHASRSSSKATAS
ncbi:MAG TPA: D-amino acid aminotransferase [Burkholderiaceae bacterium]|nr:D-amino acid aminotransferase [Burkholderiaceae bacterium]